MNSPPSPDAWAAIRAAYETTDDTPVAIARRFGIHHFAVYGRARRDHWQRPEAGAGPAASIPAEPPAPPPDPPARPAAKTAKTATKAATHRRMVERLYSIIDAKLAQMETRMPGSDDQKSSDHEREAKTIGTLISNIEKVKELDGGDAARSNTTRSNSAGGGHTYTAADTERLGRELAERLLKRAREHKARQADPSAPA